MIISLRYSLFLVCCFLFFGLLHAQNTQPFLTNFGSSTGLSFDHVNDAAFDRDGFLWVATANGLNKSDGSNTTKYFGYSNSGGEAVSGDFINRICCDSLVVWVAVKQGGVNCYLGRIDHFLKYVHNPANPNSLASNTVNCILLGSNRKLYFGTDKGLSLFSRNETRFTNFAGPADTQSPADITSIAEGENGKKWIGTSAQGIMVFDEERAMLIPIHVPPAITATRINELLYDKQLRELWIATSVGLWHARIDNRDSLYDFSRPLRLPGSETVNCIRRSSEGDLWIGTEGDGVFLYKKNGMMSHYVADNTHSHSLAGNTINRISIEKDGSVWFSTENGLSALFPDLQHFPFFKTKASATNDSLRAVVAGGLCAWKNYIVAATGAQIDIIDTEFTRSQQLRIKDNSKKTVCFTGVTCIDDRVFVTSTNGIYQVAQTGKTFMLIRPATFYPWLNTMRMACKKIDRLSNGVYLLTYTDGNVLRIDTARKKIDTVFDASAYAKRNNADQLAVNVFKYGADKIIVATGWGIRIYTNAGKLLKESDDARFIDKLSHECLVNDFYNDGSGLWFATSERGLYRCNANLDIIRQYMTENGLCDNSLYCLQNDDKGKLWLTTKNGLSVFDRNTDAFVNYSQEQGLPSHEFMPNGKACAGKQTLYFSTVAGITRVRPGEWKTDTSLPVFPSVVKATIGENNFAPGDMSVLNEMREIQVSYGNNIALTFDVISFAHAWNYTMQYRLDKAAVWSELSKGAELLLNKLSPGSHELMVRAVTKTEKRFGGPFTILIYVDSVYYQQWWFIVLVLSLAALLVYIIYSWRVGNIVKIYEVRNKIARDLHDEVGATLSGIAMYSHLAKEQMKKALLPEMENSLNVIQQGAGEMVNKLNDIVWLVNPEQDSWQKLVQRLEEYAADMAALKNISLKISVTKNIPKLVLPLETRRNIYLFCKEAINNAVKYSDCRMLELTIQETDKKLLFAIRDDGRGFDINKVKPGNGINNMKTRATAIGAALVIYSKPGEGAMLSMQVKIT